MKSKLYAVVRFYSILVDESRIFDLEGGCAVRWGLVSDVCPGILEFGDGGLRRASRGLIWVR